MGSGFLTLGVSIDDVLCPGLRLVCRAQQGWRCAVILRAHVLARAA